MKPVRFFYYSSWKIEPAVLYVTADGTYYSAADSSVQAIIIRFKIGACCRAIVCKIGWIMFLFCFVFSFNVLYSIQFFSFKFYQIWLEVSALVELSLCTAFAKHLFFLNFLRFLLQAYSSCISFSVVFFFLLSRRSYISLISPSDACTQSYVVYPQVNYDIN